MLNVSDEGIRVQFSGQKPNGNIPQGALSDLFELRRVKAIVGEREADLCKALRSYFARAVITQKGKKVVQFAAPEGTIEDGAFNVKLALNASRSYDYKGRLLDALTEIELLKSGVRRTKKNKAEARVKAEARLNAENAAITPTENAPKVLVTHKEN